MATDPAAAAFADGGVGATSHRDCHPLPARPLSAGCLTSPPISTTSHHLPSSSSPTEPARLAPRVQVLLPHSSARTASSGALTPRSSRIGLMVFLAFFFNKINRCFFPLSGILQLSCASSCSNLIRKMLSVMTGAQPLITQPFFLPAHTWVRNGFCAYFK